MSDLVTIIDSLETRISELLLKYEVLKNANKKLKEELTVSNNSQEVLISHLDDCKAKYTSLKIANAMLGSNQFKKETKLKINSLVREIDHCIAQISD